MNLFSFETKEQILIEMSLRREEILRGICK
jgi:hypothetical protein